MAAPFKIVFHPGAAKEYQKLSNPILTYVNNSLRELAERANEVGKRLGNLKYTHLAGCKEIKLRDCGYRIKVLI
jgi:mRNA interferase RelE/StbE